MDEDEFDLAFACFTAALTLLAFVLLVWLLAGCSKPSVVASIPPPPVPVAEYSTEAKQVAVSIHAATPAPTLPDGRPESAVEDLMVNAEPSTSSTSPTPATSSTSPTFAPVAVTEEKGEPPMEGVRTRGVAAVTTTVTVIHPTPAPALVGLPTVELSPSGKALIYEFETGGEKDYDRSPYPEWPGGVSGDTWGTGYDATAQSEAIIRQDWAALGATDANRLALTHPYSGETAKAHLKDIRDILVSWDLASDVFDHVDIVRTYQLCVRTFPGFEDLRPNSQAAILSVVFNRGASLVGSSRTEMRNIKDLVPKKDYAGMADQLRKMIRVWQGEDIFNGMKRRRYAEADLMETP